MTDQPLTGDDQGLQFVVDDSAAGQRVDAFLASSIPDATRARIQRSIEQHGCLVDGARCRPSHRLRAGQRVVIRLAAPKPSGPRPEAIALDVLYEDETIAVINKPAGMVVHPARGHWSGTLASAASYRFGSLSTAGGEIRPGIVHRLDRDTSGVIVIARTDVAHAELAKQFHDHLVEKQYLAIVTGHPDRDRDRVDHPIGPHPSQREKKALRRDHPESRAAETFYEVVERYRGFALVRAEPKSGRTHQIRLHLLHAGHPILCDRLYGGRSQITAGELRTITRTKGLAADLAEDAVLLDRQALHAHRLTIDHPATGERRTFEAPVPPDLSRVQEMLRDSGVL